MTLPKWATPERQAQLIGLWEQYGNRCLLGHPTCPVQEHYLYTRVSGEVVGVPAAIKVRAGTGWSAPGIPTCPRPSR